MPIKIDYHSCTGCKVCYTRCPMDVYTWDEKIDMPVFSYAEECWFCGVCWMECPARAIDFRYPASFW